jgi:hypothetical protein
MSAAIHAAVAGGGLHALQGLPAADLEDHVPLIVRHAASGDSESHEMMQFIIKHCGASECLEILAQDFDAISTEVQANEQRRKKALAADEALPQPSFVQFEEASTHARMVLLAGELLRLQDEVRV